MKHFKLCTPVLACSLIAANAVADQIPMLEEIVVTAQKREQNLQDVGISIAAFGGDQLKDMGITTTDQIAGMVPGVQIFQFGQQATTTISIRGVSQNDFADHNEAPVAVYQDGAYNSFIGGAGLALFDVERVEILRGPQGTLFGRNATGGLVQLITRKPSQEFGGYIQATGAEYGMAQVEGAIGGGLTDAISSRFALQATRDDGFVKNTVGPRKEQTRNLSTRLQFDAKPVPGLDILWNIRTVRDDVDGTVAYKTERAYIANDGLVNFANEAQFQTFCSDFFGASPPAGASDCFGFQDPKPSDPWTTANDTQGVMDRSMLGTTATITWDMLPSATLTSISDYLRLKRNYIEDTDGTSAKLFNFVSDMDSWQLSQELRLNGKNDLMNWQTGVYFLDISHDINTGIDADPTSPFGFLTANHNVQSTKSYSVFGQVDWALASHWSLTTGARYVYDEKKINIDASCVGPICDFLTSTPGGAPTVQGVGFNDQNAGGRNRRTFSDVAAKVELDWKPVEGSLTYLSINRGIKGGGFNAAAISAIPLSYVSYKPEILTAYELGTKQTFLDNRARLNASVFYYDYKDYQAFTLTGVSPFVFNTDNRTKGGELELTLAPTTGLTVTLGAAYLDAIAKRVPLNFEDASTSRDQRPPQSPKWTYDAAIRQEWRLANEATLAAQVTANYVGSRFFNTVNHPVLSDDAYTIANARLTYSMQDRWDIALWVNNLTNEKYINTAFDLSTTNGVVAQVYAPPRQAGVTFTVHYGK